MCDLRDQGVLVLGESARMQIDNEAEPALNQVRYGWCSDARARVAANQADATWMMRY